MKSTINRLQHALILMILMVIQLPLLAQEESSSTTTSSSSSTKISVTDSTATDWYASPWVWIIGAAVFILLLVALLSNRGTDRDRVIVKKTTVDRDRDVV